MKRSALSVRWLMLLVVLASGCRALENRFVYHPVRGETEKLPPHPLVRDIELRTADGRKIHGRWCFHPNGRGAILYCPGNAGNLERRGGLVKELWQQLEESVLIFDYPGFGQSEGTPSEEGCYAAANAAYKWLTETEKVAPEEIVIYGESLGGGVAVDLASRKPHRALVLARTFSSLPAAAQSRVPWLPVSSVMQNRFNNLDKMSKCKQPTFIAHADKDQLIPFSHGKKMEQARLRAGLPTQRFVLKGLGHNDSPGRDYYEALRMFLRHLPVAQTSWQSGDARVSR